MSAVETSELVVALAGNPNVGKTTLFNALTGLKQKVANYPGVTVEKKVGRTDIGGRTIQIIDLPGTYSLASRSPDEHVARRVVLGQIAGTPRPDVIVVVADASNLERNLYLVTQVLELGRPTVVALTMVDVAQQQGRAVDCEKLSQKLGAAVVPVHAYKGGEGNGIGELKKAIEQTAQKRGSKPLDLPLPEVMERHVRQIQAILAEEKLAEAEQAEFDAHLMLSIGDDEDVPDERRSHPRIKQAIKEALIDCENANVDPIGAEIEAHYAYIGPIVEACVMSQATGGADGVLDYKSKQTGAGSRSDRLDRVLTHKVWGLTIFVLIMAAMFFSIFWLAQPVMEWLNGEEGVMKFLKDQASAWMAEGPLRSLVEDGIIAGVGNVIVFLPQIAILFLFLAVLEDSGYMSRAAFLMDRIMSKVGLHGKSFIPLLSGYACAVPGIMGTRVIENKRDRFATILILPLMSCSARLPVYLLFTALFFTEAWQGTLVMLSMYALGTLSAFGMAWFFKRTLLKGPATAFILEMPPYRRPHVKTVLHTVGVRCWAYLKRAGTVIFAFSVIMWAATHYPKPSSYSEKVATIEKDVETAEARFSPAAKEKRAWEKEHPNVKEGDPSIPKFREPSADEALIDARVAKELADAEEALGFRKASEEIEYSVAGRAGKFVAPIFYPLGYDWKGSVGVMGAFFAREVIVSTMGIVYSVGEAEEDSDTLHEAMQNDVWPEGSARAGQKVWTPLTAISMMVFVVFCMQCLSTLAVAKREMGSWKWPAFMFVYMTGLAYVMALIVYQGGLWLGFK